MEIRYYYPICEPLITVIFKRDKGEPEIRPYKRLRLWICFPDTVEKKEWPAEGRTINLIWQPANCAKPTTLVSDWPMSVWALTLAQDNQLLTRCSHSLLYLAFSLFVKKLFIPEVCMYCMYMYVCTKPYYRTWTYQPEKNEPYLIVC